MRLSGFAGWLMWLAVHLVFLTGFRNRLGRSSAGAARSSAAVERNARSPFAAFGGRRQLLVSDPLADRSRSAGDDPRSADTRANRRLAPPRFRSLYRRLAQASRWGASDRRGALNNITPARFSPPSAKYVGNNGVARAADRERAVSRQPRTPKHEMTGYGRSYSRPRARIRGGPVHDERARRRR